MTARSYPDEGAFYSAWLVACASAPADEVFMALAGGELADRLSWVFMSGYQAAVRRCFPEFGSIRGWTCFAAAEGGDGPSCVLAEDHDGYRLSGEKSWIAGAGLTDELVVAVGQEDDLRFVRVRRLADGVTISLPRTPGFLGEMTQGVANFDAVAVAAADVVEDPARALWFRGAEPLFIMLALNACLRARGGPGETAELVRAADAAIAHGRALPEALGIKKLIVPGLSRLRELTRHTLATAEGVVARHPSLSRSFQADGRLLTLFGLSEGAGT